MPRVASGGNDNDTSDDDSSLCNEERPGALDDPTEDPRGSRDPDQAAANGGITAEHAASAEAARTSADGATAHGPAEGAPPAAEGATLPQPAEATPTAAEGTALPPPAEVPPTEPPAASAAHMVTEG
jgi:hypothetical protein